MEDKHTVGYFDRNVPEYSDYRLPHVVEAIRKHAGTDAWVVDVGCGVGNILESLMRETGIRHVCGIDSSAACLQKTKERIGCETIQGSVVDDAFMGSVERKFDFVLLMAVLHHLIGTTRRQSKRQAFAAVANCLKLLKPGGRLIIGEPIFYPRLTMHALFYVKKAITSVTTERIPIFGYWNNIGAPVVSYYTYEDLLEMVKAAGGLEVEEHYEDPMRVSMLQRAALITRRLDVTIIARKTDTGHRLQAAGCG